MCDQMRHASYELTWKGIAGRGLFGTAGYCRLERVGDRSRSRSHPSFTR